ncbi:MAG: Glu-tRNA(Gln) amidotransferase subunit GatE [Thermoplasmata archaeon]|nr:Glu-tRNA(Gln) amidotransferase subunit GatE [Thermoplasmata archaeon]
MKVGLEVHQQLATTKLFCSCPSELSETVTGTFLRRLRPTTGENQNLDPAVAFEASRALAFRYEGTPDNCLVEIDEEPPHSLNAEALDVALTLSFLLEATPVAEVVVMRKMVVDGSNTSGFQRTALIAVDGHLDVGGRRFSIPAICLEEDAARKIASSSGEVVYRLDRLGIPLIEIATGPDIANGEEARAVAEEIGALLRATGKVRRGIGSIREDLNVSTEGGRRIEMKGVQDLRKIAEYVTREDGRQRVLLLAQEELRRRGASAPVGPAVDLREAVESVPSGPLAEGLRKGGVVLGLALPGFHGLLASPEGSDERLGREFADQVRALGLKGLLHSDELPGYGVDADAVARIRSTLHAGPTDAFVVVTDRTAERARQALEGVRQRAGQALEGIPPETRDPLPDGRSRYSRPLPGRDRMYPETDIAPIPITAERLRWVASSLPERPAALRARLSREYGLGEQVVTQIVAGGLVETFETLAKRGHLPPIVARLLTQDLPDAVAKSPPPEPVFSVEALDAVLRATAEGRFAKEGIPSVLLALANGAPDIDTALARGNLATMHRSELDALATRIAISNAEMIRTRGEAAFSPLMGDLMREVRGRIDGKEVAAAMRRAMERLEP